MFVKFWIIWVFAGLTVSVWLFQWALRTGQFSDSRRAALLPLEEMQPGASLPKSGRFQLAVLIGIAAFGILVTCAMVVIALASG